VLALLDCPRVDAGAKRRDGLLPLDEAVLHLRLDAARALFYATKPALPEQVR
jgi:hypothetical protein